MSRRYTVTIATEDHVTVSPPLDGWGDPFDWFLHVLDMNGCVPGWPALCHARDRYEGGQWCSLNGVTLTPLPEPADVLTVAVRAAWHQYRQRGESTAEVVVLPVVPFGTTELTVNVRAFTWGG